MPGFTLIEVLVALAITSVIAVMAYGGISAALTAVERNEEQAERINSLNVFFTVLSRDLRQVVPRVVKDPFGDDFKPAVEAGENALVALEFSRGGWSNPRPGSYQRSSLQRVAYSLEEGTVYRHSWYVMDRLTDSEENKVAMLSGVSSMRFEYLQQLDVQGNPNSLVERNKLGGEWRDHWPYEALDAAPGSTANLAELPMAVRLTLELDGWGEVQRLIELPDDDV